MGGLTRAKKGFPDGVGLRGSLVARKIAKIETRYGEYLETNFALQKSYSQNIRFDQQTSTLSTLARHVYANIS